MAGEASKEGRGEREKMEGKGLLSLALLNLKHEPRPYLLCSSFTTYHLY